MVNPSPDDHPQKRRPTLTDVARQAGVGLTAASYALRSHPKISEATRLRVRAVADTLGYRVNATVGRLMAELRSDRPGSDVTTLAWINCHEERDVYYLRPWLNRWLEGARARANQLGWQFEEMWLHDPALGAKRLQQVLRTRAIPGLLIAPTHTTGGAFEMDCSSFGVATMARTFRQPRFHQAAPDDFANTVVAIDELQKLGYRRIGFCSEPLVCEWTDRRQLGAYAQAFVGEPARQKIPPLIQTENQPGDFKVFERWFRRWKPDAIISPSRRHYEWLQEMGVRIPEDCGVAHLNLGVDVLGWAGIDPQIEWIAASAVDMLVGQIHRHETGPPPVPKELLIKGLWTMGHTVRAQG